jgi:hypothetical protein
VRGLARQASVCGIGASLAIRRSTFEKLHGFDEQLGAGTALAAGEDTDMAIRALISGDAVHETPAAVVTHHGFRPWNEGHVVIQGYMRGLGAVHVKMLRLGRARAARPLLALAWRWLARGPVVDLNHRPPRLSRLRAYLAGSWHAWGLPVDRATGWYVPVQPSFSRLALNDDRRSRVSIVRAADARGN